MQQPRPLSKSGVQRTKMCAALAEIRSISKVVALVTGGASGLGKATAARLARQVRIWARASVLGVYSI